MNRIINKIGDNFRKKPELIILFSYFLIVLVLINKIPINPDEYLYSAIGNNFADAFRGQACFSCIDPYHTFLLPLVISFFNFLTGVDSIIAYRIIGSLFSIAAILLIYRLFKEIFRESRYFPLALLLLFPGFFYFGCMVWLDNLAFFFFVLLLYLIVRKSSYWKVGIVLALLFISKDYYIIFGGTIISVVTLYDAISLPSDKKLSYRMKFFLKNIIISFSFTMATLLSIELFHFLPYPNMQGALMLTLFGETYKNIGFFLHELLYSNLITGHSQDIIAKNAGVVINNPQFNMAAYFESMFRETYVNLYALPLFFYGIFVWLKKRKMVDIRNAVIMFGLVAISILFFTHTATLGLSGFRFAFISIIPIIFFIVFAMDDLLDAKRLEVRHYILILLSLVYIIMCLFGIQEGASKSIIYNSKLAQAFLKIKFIFNVALYVFPAVIIFSKIKINIRKIILIGWIIVTFLYKIGPVIINNYLVNGKSSIEYNLPYARGVLSKIENSNPNILTNYERAYYYYTDSIKMPNDIRENLPIIRPKPSIIYAQRVFELSEDNWARITSNYLCEKNIDYVFFVNDCLDNGLVAKRIATIKGIYLIDEFYKNNNLNWIIYRFDKKNCS